MAAMQTNWIVHSFSGGADYPSRHTAAMPVVDIFWHGAGLYWLDAVQMVLSCWINESRKP